MWARLWNRSARMPCAGQPDTLPQLYSMYMGLGMAGVTTFMPPGGLSGSQYATLMAGRSSSRTGSHSGDRGRYNPRRPLSIPLGREGEGMETAQSITSGLTTTKRCSGSRFDVTGARGGGPFWTPYTGAANTVPRSLPWRQGLKEDSNAYAFGTGAHSPGSETQPLPGRTPGMVQCLRYAVADCVIIDRQCRDYRNHRRQGEDRCRGDNSDGITWYYAAKLEDFTRARIRHDGCHCVRATTTSSAAGADVSIYLIDIKTATWAKGTTSSR